MNRRGCPAGRGRDRPDERDAELHDGQAGLHAVFHAHGGGGAISAVVRQRPQPLDPHRGQRQFVSRENAVQGSIATMITTTINDPAPA